MNKNIDIATEHQKTSNQPYVELRVDYTIHPFRSIGRYVSKLA
ncbi:hypothetical protein [Paenibacillus brasilensis]|uniref:Uncharacterized protein n=1 Tax=Paenibacillus brasilensis TaxID=128574 RepID=A0ABU0KYP1_9BACL|nr:hypothetical protein [Paenibacillus brasilensis]